MDALRAFRSILEQNAQTHVLASRILPCSFAAQAEVVVVAVGPGQRVLGLLSATLHLPTPATPLRHAKVNVS